MNWLITHGGHSPNVVPDHAEAILDIRYPPPLARESVGKTVNDAIGDVTAGRIVYEVLNDRAGFETNVKDAFVSEILQAIDVNEVRGTRAYTDGSVYAAMLSCPVIILGPGSIEQAQRTDEFVDPLQLDTALQIYTKLLGARST